MKKSNAGNLVYVQIRRGKKKQLNNSPVKVSYQSWIPWVHPAVGQNFTLKGDVWTVAATPFMVGDEHLTKTLPKSTEIRQAFQPGIFVVPFSAQHSVFSCWHFQFNEGDDG